MAAAAEPAGQIAFPGAEGFGRFSQGGRGGRVMKVTNLDDSGPGSLRAAVEAEGPRTVVFDVGGVIRLKSDLKITNDHITIAGQSAPGFGITLRDGQFLISANHVIVRYLRSRVGDEAGKENDSISIGSGSDIILDHISSGWSIDESLSVTQKVNPDLKHLTNVTVQWSLISESLNHSIHEKGEHGYGSLLQGSYGAKYSFHHNLWAHHEARMPRIGNYAKATDDPEGILLDFRDNVFYNWGPGATTDFYNWEPGVSRGYAMDPFYGRPDNGSRFAAGEDLNTNSTTHSNFINNYYIQGANTGGPLALYIRNKSGKTHFAGNWMDDKLVADQKSLVLVSTAAPGDHVMDTPFDAAPVTLQDATTAYRMVLDRSGASKARDPIDARVVDSVRKRTGKIINSQKDVGGWFLAKSNAAPKDTDGDGMPDAWEKARKLNPRDASDASDASKDGDGYTNIENYLNSLVK
ncbi:pectate lyase [soil metagenome]